MAKQSSNSFVTFVKDHYGKAVAFLTGWLAEFLAGMSEYVKSALAAIGVGG